MHFDWTTLALQTVNLLVLVWLLRRFLFRPVLDIIAQRRAAAEKLLADAAATREAADRQAADIGAQRNTVSAQATQILAEAEAAAKNQQAELLQQARDAAARAQDAARAALEQERTATTHELESQAHQLAVTIAARLLSRIPAQACSAALLQSLDTWLGSLPASDLNNLATPGETLEVVTATSLDASQQATCAEMLRRRLGDVMLRFAVDPDLIAGVELRTSHARLRNNWRADLDRIAQELNQDEQHLAMA